MIQLKEEKIKTIIDCDGCQSVECVINNAIWNMQDEGINNDTIMEFIQKLDVSLLLYKCSDESPKEADNVKFAREILMNKILNGVDV